MFVIATNYSSYHCHSCSMLMRVKVEILSGNNAIRRSYEIHQELCLPFRKTSKWLHLWLFFLITNRHQCCDFIETSNLISFCVVDRFKSKCVKIAFPYFWSLLKCFFYCRNANGSMVCLCAFFPFKSLYRSQMKIYNTNWTDVNRFYSLRLSSTRSLKHSASTIIRDFRLESI